LRYPELAAWEMLFTDGLRESYAAIYKTVKTAKPAVPVGWHIWHNNSFNPIYRAEQDLHELSNYSDFIKVVMYNNCGGERMALYADNIGSTLYRDLSKQALIDLNYSLMGFKEGSYDQIPRTGLSADYVYRETRRALEGVAGTNTRIWPGIDIDIPTEPNHSKCTPQSVKQAVLAAFRAGAPGVLLSRKYSEMRLANLSGAGDAIRELKLYRSDAGSPRLVTRSRLLGSSHPVIPKNAETRVPRPRRSALWNDRAGNQSGLGCLAWIRGGILPRSSAHLPWRQIVRCTR
jgi:hypothetical protein